MRRATRRSRLRDGSTVRRIRITGPAHPPRRTSDTSPDPSRLAELLAQLVLRAHQRPLAGRRQVLAGTIDIEREHGERGAKGTAFPAPASFGRPFQGRRDPLGIAGAEDALIEGQRIAVFGHMPRPTAAFPRRPTSPRAVALAPGASPRCSCFSCHRATTCKSLSLRLNAAAHPLFRGSLHRPPAALSRREMHEAPGNRCQ